MLSNIKPNHLSRHACFSTRRVALSLVPLFPPTTPQTTVDSTRACAVPHTASLVSARSSRGMLCLFLLVACGLQTWLVRHVRAMLSQIEIALLLFQTITYLVNECGFCSSGCVLSVVSVKWVYTNKKWSLTTRICSWRNGWSRFLQKEKDICSTM